MSNLAYGLDFGTTNSAVAWVQAGRPILARVEKNGGTMLRSVLFFPDDEQSIYLGGRAIDEYLISDLKGRFIQSVKSCLASDFESTWIRGTEYGLEDLVHLIMRQLKEQADRETGQDVTRAVLGRPVSFSDDVRKNQQACDRLLGAATMAGFTDVTMMYEPLAAALSYELDLKRSELVLVADLGGGTSDFTLMQLGPQRVRSDDRSPDVIGQRGIQVAGDAFDKAIMEDKIALYFGKRAKYKNTFGNWLPIPANIIMDLCDKSRLLNLYTAGTMQTLKTFRAKTDEPISIDRFISVIKHNRTFALHKTVEALKCDLSDSEHAAVEFSLQELRLDIALSRQEFEQIIAGELARIEECVDRLLEETGISPARVDTVFMTGGSSLVRGAQAILADKFGAGKIRLSPSMFTNVVEGLAIAASLRR